MKIGQFKLKMLFVLFAGFLLAAGCSESDSPEFEQSRRLVRNLYLAPVMSVYAGHSNFRLHLHHRMQISGNAFLRVIEDAVGSRE